MMFLSTLTSAKLNLIAEDGNWRWDGHYDLQRIYANKKCKLANEKYRNTT